MFSIHPGLRRYLWRVLVFAALCVLIGVVFPGLMILSNHQMSRVGNGLISKSRHATTRDALVVSGIFLLLGISFIWSNIAILRRASKVIRGYQSLPALLSTRKEGNIHVTYLASLRPVDNSNAPFRPVKNIEVYLGITSPIPVLPIYRDCPAEAYVPPGKAEPVVYIVNGKYWCSL